MTTLREMMSRSARSIASVGASDQAVAAAVAGFVPQAPSSPARLAPEPPASGVRLGDLLAQSSATADPLKYSDVVRIAALPIMHPLAPEEREEVSRKHLLSDAYESGFRLFPQQADGIFAVEENVSGRRGLFGNIGVGWGKTLLSLMIAEEAWARSQGAIDRIVLSVPPHVMLQLLLTDIPAARRRIPLSVPIISLYGKSKSDRLSIASSSRRGLFLIPHSLYSVPDAVEMLLKLKPGKFIIDECHAFSDRASARTKRLVHVLGETQPEFCCLSGSMSTKSVLEYHHLIVSALTRGAPLPISPSAATQWGLVIDANSPEDVDRAQVGPIKPLIAWARKNFPEEAVRITEDRTGFRHAYRCRLNTTPGVVSSGDQELGVSLTILNHAIPEEERLASPGWSDLAEHMRRLEEEWISPNGDEIEHAIHLYRWRFELAAGFYNRLTWPDEDWLKARGDTNPRETLRRALEWHDANRAYLRLLRSFFGGRHIPGLDTPLTVARELSQHKDRTLPTELWQAYAEQAELRWETMPERLSTAVRVCPFRLHAVARSVQENSPRGSITWIWNREILSWAGEVWEEFGLNPLVCGQHADAAILDPGNANRHIIASISAHGTGKNLQHHQDTYYIQFPRSARLAEQVLGRTHRNGQKADELFPRTFRTLPFDEECFSATLVDAAFVRQTSGIPQRLLFANYEPLPTIYPPEFLRERGMENALLDAEGRKILEDKFLPQG